jgi:hypothetical protein
VRGGKIIGIGRVRISWGIGSAAGVVRLDEGPGEAKRRSSWSQKLGERPATLKGRHVPNPQFGLRQISTADRPTKPSGNDADAAAKHPTNKV